MKTRKTLSNWLTNRYLLILRNEENFAEKTTFSFNYARLILFIISVFIFFQILTFYMSTTILARWFDPRAKELEFNKRLVELSLAVDSLSNEVEKKELFIASMKRVLSDDNTQLTAEGDKNISDSKTLTSVNIDKINAVDANFREEYEKEGAETVNLKAKRESLQSIFMFPPIKGVISSGYNSKISHFGVDLVAPKNEPIKAVSDGTVIIASWTQDSGYVIGIQHKNNLVSFYKHNSALLKKVGNFVKAGDIVSIIGNSGELTNGPHLHFELWYDGNPVNPQQYITF